MASRIKTSLCPARRVRPRRWQRNGFFRPACEALEERSLLTAASPDDGYAQAAPAWFARLPSGLSTYSAQAFIGPLSLAVGNSGGSSQMPAEVAQWIVRLSPQATQQAGSVYGIEALLNTETVAFDALRGLGLPGQMLVEGGTATEVVRAALAGNPHVASFEPNSYVAAQALTPNDPDFPTLTGLSSSGQFGATADADIDAPEAWEENTGSTSVVVGVIDSGIDYTHPDLYLNVWMNQGEIPASLKTQLVDTDADGRITFYDLNEATNASRVSDLNGNTYIDAGDLFADPRWTDGVDTDRNSFVDDLVGWNFRSAVDEPFEPNDPQDVLGHGTHVSGTIGAIGNNNRGVTGINWRTSLMALKFLDDGNTGQTADAIASVNYATMMRTQYGENVRVINASWGQSGSESPALRDAIEASGQADMLFIAAAGNGNILGQGINLDRDPFFPASSDQANVISVAASGPADELARFSNFGRTAVDLAAPGIGVLSTLPGGRYGTANGTSMAAPHVAGVAALILSELPFASSSEVKQAILGSVDTANAFNTFTATGGRLNAERALDSTVFAPRATLVTAPNITTAGGTENLVTVTYRDRQGIDDTTIGDGDIIATRQWGPRDTITAMLVPDSIVSVDNGTEVTASYSIAAPGGSWDPLDFGSYVFSAVPGQVKNTTGVFVPSDSFGEFSVRISDPSVLYVNTFTDGVDDGSCISAHPNDTCTLRAAIQEANAVAPTPRTIILDEGTFQMTIVPESEIPSSFALPADASGCFTRPYSFIASDVKSGDFDIRGQITLFGNLAQSTVIDGQSIDRVFKVHPEASLSLNRLTVSGGAAQYGGGILSSGSLALDLSTVTFSSATADGGGIAIWDGQAEIHRSTLTTNRATRGGGLFACNGAEVNVSASTIDNNVAEAGGGLSSNFGGAVQITNSTISQNTGEAIRGTTIADRFSTHASVSADGRFVAFQSDASHLVPDKTSLASDIYVLDRRYGSVQRVSLTNGGVQANGDSLSPSISADGRFVAFESHASNLVPGDTNEKPDIFVVDRNSGTIERVSVRNDGSQLFIETCFHASISADGKVVAFGEVTSSGSVTNIYAFDRESRQLEQINTVLNGVPANTPVADPSISGDGRFVAFYAAGEIFVFDRETRQVDRVNAGQSNQYPSLSFDGRFVAFSSDGFVKVLDRNTRELDTLGGGGNIELRPKISGDGRFVAYEGLYPNNELFNRTVGVYDRELDQGYGPGTPSEFPAISADGRVLVFNTYSRSYAESFVSRIEVYDLDSGLQSPFNPGAPLVQLDNTTVADNRGVKTLAGPVQARNSLFTRNGSQMSSQAPSLDLVSLGHNLSDAPPGRLRNVNSDIVAGNVGSGVGPLADNGGPIRTHALLPGSAAIDAADPATSSATDQRGVIRPQDGDGLFGSQPDIGAYETFEGRIHGTVFRDDNHDGQRGSGDAGVSGQLVYLDLNRNSLYDPGEPATTTRADDPSTSAASEEGSYVFSDLALGTYYVRQLTPPGWSAKRPTIARLSTAPSGVEADKSSGQPSISGDGRFVAFVSGATNLVPGGADVQPDLFVYDRQTRAIERLTDSAVGVGIPSISADGRYVAFSSSEPLVPGDTNQSLDVFVFDRQNRQFERVSINSDSPSISGDGRYVAYVSSINNGQSTDIFVFDRLNKQAERLTSTQTTAFSGAPSISADGRFVAFESTASNLVPGDTNNVPDVFLYDRETDQLDRISVSLAGAEGNLGNHLPAISANGRFVAFQAVSTNLVPGDTNTTPDIFVFDRQTRGIERVSLRSDGGQSNGESRSVAISGDGRFVTFESFASNLVADDTNQNPDIFVFDRESKKIERLSIGSNGSQANSDIANAAISADGRFVAFDSYSSSLVVDDSGEATDVFLTLNRAASEFDSQTVSLFAGEVVSAIDFGLIPQSGQVAGRCFDDLIANGVDDEGEPGRAGCVIYLDLNTNGRFDPTDASTTSALDGTFAFLNLESEMEYQVGLAVVPNGQTLVLPSANDNGSYNVFLPAGGTISDRDFGLRPANTLGQFENAAIQGRLFVSQPGTGVAGIELFVDLDDDGVRDFNEPRTTSAADGSYSFAGLGNRPYTVRTLNVPQNLVQMSPIGNRFERDVYSLSAPERLLGSPQDVVVGDFNNDTWPDLAAVMFDGNAVAIVLNDGRGGFRPTPIDIPLAPAGRPVNQPRGTGPIALVAGNFNNSGGVDLAVANSFSANVAILLDFNGTTFASEKYVSVGLLPSSLATGDLEGDGDVDLVITNNLENPTGTVRNVALLRNGGQGTFTADAAPPTAGNNPSAVVTGRFNNDPLLDLAITSFGTNPRGSDLGDVRVLLANANGTFQSSAACEVGFGPSALTAADLNGDQKLDLAVANFLTDNVTICLGSGNGTFTAAATLPGGSGPTDISADDIDNDNDLDLLVSNGKSQKIAILRSRQSGGSFGFDPAESFGAATFGGVTRLALAAGDLDRDGDIDLAVASNQQNELAVHSNKLVGGAHRQTLTGVETVSGLDFVFEQINLAPTLNPITPLSIVVNEDAQPITVNLSGISAGAAEDQPLRVNVEFPALIASAVPQYQSPNATGSIVLTLSPNQSGQANVVVTVTDGGLDRDLNTPADNSSVSQTFSLTVNPLNDPPTFDQLPAILAIDRNAATQTINLTGLSAGGGESQPLRVTATTTTPQWIQNLALQQPGSGTTATITYTTTNTGSSGQITITLTDGGLDSNLNTLGDNLSVSQTIGIASTNNPPTVSLANAVPSLLENSSTAGRVKLADIQVNDDGVGSQLVFLMGADARFFEVVGTELFLAAGVSLDHETKPQYAVTVAVDDTAIGATPDATTTLTLNVTNVNEPPSVALINATTSLPENSVTVLRRKLADIRVTDDSLAGSIVLGLAGADASFFEIVDTELFLSAGVPLDFETKPQYVVNVMIDDPSVGNTPDATSNFTLNLENANDAPTDLFLTNFRILESTDTSAGPVQLGRIIVLDEDRSANAYAFSLTAGEGADDNGQFEISGNNLRLKQGVQLDAEDQSTYAIRVRLVDGPHILEQPFEILVTDVLVPNQAPSFVKGSDQLVTEDDGPRGPIAWATAISKGPLEEQFQALTFLVTGNTNPGIFKNPPAIDSTGRLTFTPKPNTRGVAEITIVLTDDGGTADGGSDTSAPQTFTIQVIKTHPWHNAIRPLDVRGGNSIELDNFVDAGDVLAIINYINSVGAGPIPADAAIGRPFGFLDTNSDNSVAADDALEIINAINTGQGGEGEPASRRYNSSLAAQSSPPILPATERLDDYLLSLLGEDIALHLKRRR